jgi:RNA polymerase sigma-70 factor (ECF subfamily)
MNLTEEEIIEGCIRKRRKAQKALYEKYHRRMLGICVRYCTTRAEAEDVMVEGFMNIYSKIKSFTGQGSFEGWMRRVMVNTAIDNYRKNKKRLDNENLDNVAEKLSHEPVFHENLAAEEILKMVTQLPSGYRIVFNLYAIEGYSHLEIGQMLGISENTSKTQLFKARKLLQRMIHQSELEKTEPKENG